MKSCIFSVLNVPWMVLNDLTSQHIPVDMGVDFRRVQMFMPQDLLDRFHVHAAAQHEGGGGVAELVAGVEGSVQTGLFQPLLDHIVNCVSGHTGVPPGEKQGISVRRRLVAALCQPSLDGLLAGVIEINDALLVALAQYSKLFAPNVAEIEAHQLRNTQAAVEKEYQDAIIPCAVGLVHAFQKLDALIEAEIPGQCLFQPGRVQVLHGIFGD